jgi:uncharacterized phiE125 gp8 family phage protein
MSLDRVIEPAVPPLHALALQDHVRQDISTDNPQLDYFIRAARLFAEAKCNRTLIASRWKLTLDAFPSSGNPFAYGSAFSLPGSAILLERGPVLAVQSIKYIDMSGVQQTLAATEYVADLSGQLARITPRFGKVWPANTLPQIGAVEVLFDAGDAAGISVDVNANVCAVLGGVWKPLTVGATVRFTNSGGALPAPLVVDTDYFIQSLPTATSFTLAATSGGAVIDITSAGTGQSYIGGIGEDLGLWMKLRVGDAYDNRNAITMASRGVMLEHPYLDAMLADKTLRLY